MSLQRQPKKRAQLSIDNKREICEYARQRPTLSHTDISHYFNEKFNLSIDRSTVSKILSNKEKWLNTQTTKRNSSTFRQRSVKHPKLDKAMELGLQSDGVGIDFGDLH